MNSNELTIWDLMNDDSGDTKNDIPKTVSIIQKIQEEQKEQDIVVDVIKGKALFLHPISKEKLDGCVYNNGLEDVSIIAGRILDINKTDDYIQVTVKSRKDKNEMETIEVTAEDFAKSDFKKNDIINALVKDSKCIELRPGPFFGDSKWIFKRKSNPNLIIEVLIKS